MWRGRRAINPGNIFLGTSFTVPYKNIYRYTRKFARIRRRRVIYYIYITIYTEESWNINFVDIYRGLGRGFCLALGTPRPFIYYIIIYKYIYSVVYSVSPGTIDGVFFLEMHRKTSQRSM